MSVGAQGDRRARRRSEEWATKLLLVCMRYCRCDEVRGGNDMRSLVCTAVLLPTWRAVVESGRGQESGQHASSSSTVLLLSSTLPDTTPVDCFISRVESMLQIPRMRSNQVSEGSDGLRSVPLAHSLSSHPCQIVRYHSTNNPPSHVLTDCRAK